ncbi:SLOG family protein [Streptomyces sp. NPDC001404]|uniref:SLOG family protein n=1 Tax=Streptomyces sp. NPDC001404 TaxID=3364571 RepID=UPI00368CCD9F
MTNPPPGPRVIVTGSRDWPDSRRVRAALNDVFDGLQPGQTLTVVHGACNTGADMHAHMWCVERQHLDDPVVEEPHPADWALHGKAAGPIRNERMVRLGADMVLAFARDASRGASHAEALACAAGIPVHRWSA